MRSREWGASVGQWNRLKWVHLKKVLLGDHDFNGATLEKAAQIMKRIRRAYDASIAGRLILSNKWPNYLWIEETAELPTVCFWAWRIYQRTRVRPDFEEKQEAYTHFRSGLKRAIHTSKRECFKEVWAKVELKPSRATYRFVTTKMMRLTLEVTCPTFTISVRPQYSQLRIDEELFRLNTIGGYLTRPIIS